MRLRLDYDLEKQFIAKDYNRCVLSQFKKSLTEYENGRFIKMLYPGNAEAKNYAFAVFMPDCVFEEDCIQIKQRKFSVTFSTNDYGVFMALHNASLKQRGKAFPLPMNNRMRLKSLELLPEKQIWSQQIEIKMLSPICVRRHEREGNKDVYYTCDDSPEEFKTQLKENIASRLKRQNIIDMSFLDGFDIKPVCAKKTVCIHYGQKIQVSLGKFILTGNPLLLTYLYQTGIGSRLASGYGLFDII